MTETENNTPQDPSANEPPTIKRGGKGGQGAYKEREDNEKVPVLPPSRGSPNTDNSLT